MLERCVCVCVMFPFYAIRDHVRSFFGPKFRGLNDRIS